MANTSDALKKIIEETIYLNRDVLSKFVDYEVFLKRILDKSGNNQHDDNTQKIKESFQEIKSILREKDCVDTEKHRYFFKKRPPNEYGSYTFYGLFVILVIIILMIKAS